MRKESKQSENLGLNKGVNGGVTLSVLGAPGEEQGGEIVKKLVVAMVKFEMPTKAPSGTH